MSASQAETDVLACQVDTSGVVHVKDGWNPLPNYSPNQLDEDQNGVCTHGSLYSDGKVSCS